MMGLYLGVTFLYSAGTFMAPLEAEFGWSREQISFGVSILGGLGAFMHAGAGMLTDRFGARNVGLIATVAYSLTIILLSQIGSNIWHWWGGVALVALAFGGMSSVVWTTGVVSQFDKNRGAGVAIVQLGPALALATLPLLSTWLIAEIGWRGAYLVIAGAGLLIIFPAIAFGFRDRRIASTTLAGGTQSNDLKWSFLRSRAFWALAAAILFAVSGLSGTSIHFMPMLGDRGLDRIEAATVAGFIGIGSIIGRLTAGLALDRFPSQIVGVVAFLMPGVAGIVLLTAGSDTVTLACAALIAGIALGAEIDVAAYVSSRLFGLARFGTVFGLLVACMSLATAIGPWVAGRLYDGFGGYREFQFYLIGSSLAAAVLLAFLGRSLSAGPSDAP
jgi:predicted MFS family arabinose efflux permease